MKPLSAAKLKAFRSNLNLVSDWDWRGMLDDSVFSARVMHVMTKALVHSSAYVMHVMTYTVWGVWWLD
jgi:hypothetical protein